MLTPHLERGRLLTDPGTAAHNRNELDSHLCSRFVMYSMRQITNLPYVKGLREHLLAAGAGQPQVPVPVTPSSQIHQAHSASPHSHAIDPAIAGPGYTMSAGDSGGDGHLSEGRKGRRELSTSKRAAQNRAAQVCRVNYRRVAGVGWFRMGTCLASTTVYP